MLRRLLPLVVGTFFGVAVMVSSVSAQTATPEPVDYCTTNPAPESWLVCLPDGYIYEPIEWLDAYAEPIGNGTIGNDFCDINTNQTGYLNCESDHANGGIIWWLELMVPDDTVGYIFEYTDVWQNNNPNQTLIEQKYLNSVQQGGTSGNFGENIRGGLVETLWQTPYYETDQSYLIGNAFNDMVVPWTLNLSGLGDAGDIEVGDFDSIRLHRSASGSYTSGVEISSAYWIVEGYSEDDQLCNSTYTEPVQTPTPSPTVDPTVTPSPTSTPAPPTDVNLLQNPSWEGSINDWYDIDVSGYSATNSTGINPAHGSYILQSPSSASDTTLRQDFGNGLSSGYYYLCVNGRSDSGIATGYVGLDDDSFTLGESFDAQIVDNLWRKVDGVVYLPVDIDFSNPPTFFVSTEADSGTIYYDNAVMYRSDSEGNPLPPDGGNNGDATAVPYATVPYDDIPFIPTGDEDDAVPPITAIDHGITCITFGPFDLSLADENSNEEFGFELCVHEWEFVVGLLGYTFSTNTFAFLFAAGVIFTWLRTR